MKLQFLLCHILWFGLPVLASSQNECGTHDQIPSSGTGPETVIIPCFDAEQVFEDCQPVYINVTLHIFTTSDCQGNVQQLNSNQTDGFVLTKQLIKNSNALRANNPEQWPRQDPHELFVILFATY